jgi:Cu+-exporting ATPase
LKGLNPLLENRNIGEAMSANKKEKERIAEKKAEDEKKTEKSRLVVSVTGMDCATCTFAIEKQVKKIKGIDDVKAAIMLNKVFIDYDPNIVDSVTIRKAIDKTGFKSYVTVEEKRARKE